ncbi:MAG: CHC2 zinc finger domain-containing protein [Candidatus Pacebacteria bacterium]|nr:CHC2 zinc finger domain-containing protein [Candidatus Paceibacterota bacterium]
MSSDVERIKERLSIVDVVSPYVKLEKSGKTYKGKSPFTTERTPSFFVSPETNLFSLFFISERG